jgi:hypothetical protein
MDAAPRESFNFDQWCELARQDPDEFERHRLLAIEQTIERTIDTARLLRGLQWRIDTTRSLARTPLKACIDISGMMWDSLLALDFALKNPKQLLASQHHNAAIFQFRRREPN